MGRVLSRCAATGPLEPGVEFRLRVALLEAISNAILHGNRERPWRRVRLRGWVEPGLVRVTVADEGDGFDPAAVPDPTTAERAGHPGGRGLLLMRRLADGVWHNERGNEVTLRVAPRRGPPGR